MMRFAVRKGYLETNPCSPIELVKDPNEKKTEMQYWTLEQFNLFIPYGQLLLTKVRRFLLEF